VNTLQYYGQIIVKVPTPCLQPVKHRQIEAAWQVGVAKHPQLLGNGSMGTLVSHPRQNQDISGPKKDITSSMIMDVQPSVWI